MNERHRDCIVHGNLVFLDDNLDMNDEFLSHLVAADVLSQSQRDSLQVKARTSLA